MAEAVPHLSGDKSVYPSYENSNFPRARGARFRPSWARFGGSTGPAWGCQPKNPERPMNRYDKFVIALPTLPRQTMLPQHTRTTEAKG